MEFARHLPPQAAVQALEPVAVEPEPDESPLAHARLHRRLTV